MFLRQYLHTQPAIGISYLLGCAGKAIAVVVDPMEDFDGYTADAEAVGATIRYVIDTHVHADHRSGARQLAAATGAEYILWQGTETSYAFRGVEDGDTLEAGNVILRVLHTPGHTPEHLCLLVTDRARGAEPWAVLTGHTLMVGDMGRTELATSQEEGARDLFRSAARLKQLPAHVEVLPGAFAGSVCGRGLSGKPFSTIGYEQRMNRAFAIADEAAFLRLMREGVPPRPPGAEATRAHNLGNDVALV